MPRPRPTARGARRAGRRAGGAIVLLALAGGALSACGLGAQSSPQALDPQAVPYGLLHRTVPPTTSPSPWLVNAPVVIYLEGSSGHLVAVHREVPWPATLASALDQLASGPSASESSRGLASPASAVGPLGSGRLEHGVVTVDLPVSFESLGGEDQTMAAAQIVYTVTTFSGVRGVRFLVGGQAAQVPKADGGLTTKPSTRRDYVSLAG